MSKVFSKVTLAAALALGLHLTASAAYSSLGTIDVNGTATFKAVTTDGTFNDLFGFSAAMPASGAFASTSISFNTYGAEVQEINIYKADYQLVASIDPMTRVSATPTVSTAAAGGANVYTLSTFTPIESNTPYTFQVIGTSKGEAGYTGIIALTNNTTLPPVPEPETYAMLLAGLGMMGMIARRRQKNR